MKWNGKKKKNHVKKFLLSFSSFCVYLLVRINHFGDGGGHADSK